MSSNDELEKMKRSVVRMTVFAVLAAIFTAFCFFCLVESVVLLFVPGTFSFVLPAVSTALCGLAFIALPLVGRGDR